jgi:hypothetical protein
LRRDENSAELTFGMPEEYDRMVGRTVTFQLLPLRHEHANYAFHLVNRCVMRSSAEMVRSAMIGIMQA